MKTTHGGDIYRNHVQIDFSVNINPLGIPKEVEMALYEAISKCNEYPDIEAEKLQNEVSRMLSVPKEYLLLGNGASELFMAVVHAIKPKKIVIPIPSFYGYEHAANATDGEIIYHKMSKEEGFCLTGELLQVLTKEVDLLFIANPNNPTGKLLDYEFLKKLLFHCQEKQIMVVLDECFIEFCDSNHSMLSKIETFENLLLVRAFTKSFAIPGVRLGYLICSNQMLLDKVKKQLPEWNLSIFAQDAGCACAKHKTYIEETKAFIKKERQFLADGLRKFGLMVFEGDANFLFVYSETALYDELLKQGILIRDCANFRGLTRGYYRIAIKSRADNEKLIKVIGELS